jgi:protein-disulfide isomerase
VPLLEQVLEKNPETVKLVYKNFPLGSHKFAAKAATAALAAGDQGKFWEFHDLLFQNYNKLNDEKINEIALSLNLDQAAYQEKLKDPEINNLIRKDTMEGQLVGVRGTPTLFVNGILLKDRSLNGFQAIIDRELAKQAKKTGKSDS